jgi:hypothetical protein
MQVMEGISLLDHVLAFSWWGAPAWMRSYGEALEDLALGKQGRFLLCKTGRDEGDLNELLKRAALAACAAGSELRQRELSASHRALMAFLKEGA